MGLKTWALLACSVAALGACSSSGSSRRPGEADPIRALLSADTMMFVAFDADGDLSINAAEIDAGLQREFTRGDSNNDGSWGPIEFQSWSNAVLGGGQMGPYRLDFDRNVDNAITRAEFDTEIRARVADYDEDNNGVLVRSEFVRLVGQARQPTRPRVEPGVLPPSR